MIRQRISLSGKLILNFLLVSIAAIAIVGTLSYFSSKNAIRDRTLNHLTSICFAKKNNIESFFAERKNEIKVISRSEDIFEALQKMPSQTGSTATEGRLDLWRTDGNLPYMVRYLKNCGYYSTLFLGDTSGHIAVCSLTDSSGNPSFASYREATDLLPFNNPELHDKNNAHLTDYRKASGKTYPLLINICLTDENLSVIGHLALEFNPACIDRIMSESDPMEGLGITGETYLVGEDGMLRSQSRFVNPSVLSTHVSNAAVENALTGKTGVTEVQDYRAKKVFNAHSPLAIDDLNWIILAEIDYNEAMSAIYALRGKTLWISLIVILLISIYFYVISKRITLPVIRLKNAAEKIGQGDFDTSLEIRSSDEIGALTDSFNQMAVQLKNMTSTLKEREERLTHFYDATLDGIILHEDNKPLLVNQAIVRLTGYSEEELMQNDVSAIFNFNMNSPYRIPLRPVTYETTARKKDGTSFPVEVQVSSIEYKGKMILASILRDITRRMNIEEELREERLKRLSWVIDGQEIERERIARELHDGLGQMLVGIKLRLESVIDNEDPKTQKFIGDLRNMFDTTIEEIRRISNNIMPSGLQEFGIVNALRKLCNDISEHSDTQVVFETLNFPDQLANKTILYLYRIAQEAINNSVKHALATEIRVILSGTREKIFLQIQDNGKGFTFDKTHKFVGNGLYNIRERVNMLNGQVDIKTASGQGTTVSVTVPV